MSICELGLMPWLNEKIFDPIVRIVRRGTEPKQLAFSTALGFTLGVFPICEMAAVLINMSTLFPVNYDTRRPQILLRIDEPRGIVLTVFFDWWFSYYQSIYILFLLFLSGTTVFLCGLAIGLIGNRCHAPSVILANFVATPIELSLVVPFLRLGEVISGSPHFPLTSDALKKVLTGHASRDIIISILHALLGWIIAAPFILGALYAVLVPSFKFLVQRYSDMPASPKKQNYPYAEGLKQGLSSSER